jgi:hypothetical protein
MGADDQDSVAERFGIVGLQDAFALKVGDHLFVVDQGTVRVNGAMRLAGDLPGLLDSALDPPTESGCLGQEDFHGPHR